MHYRIGLDARMLRHTGIGTYLRGLLGGFEQIGFGQGDELALFGGGGQADFHLKGTGTPAGSQSPENLPVPFTAPIYSIQEQFAYPRLLRQCALWHAPHYNVPLFKGKTKLVVTIHDIIHWIFRKRLRNPLKELYAGTMMRRALSTADHVIAVSQNTKKDLVLHFGAKPEKITVIHEGAGPEYRELPQQELASKFSPVKQKYSLPDDFFLFVGLMKPHKNVLHLIRVFRELKAAKKLRSCLVLAGRKDKKYPSGFEELAGLRSSADIIHIPEVSSEELPVLYNQALALVHPSLYEGFGLTVLEAMKCGTPVISSNAASLPEVAGDAALLVDPSSERELADALAAIESNTGIRETLRVKGLARSAAFDWKKTAQRTAEIYRQVLAKR